MTTNRKTVGHNQAAKLRQLFEDEQQNELQGINAFSTVLPICARCKRIRNVNGSWENRLEYFRAHHKADYTHTICPTCAKLLYPELFEARR
jgi:hypothetical protein